MWVRAAGVLLALSAGPAGLVGLVGCGDPNAGSAAAGEFDAWWPEHRVEGFEATSSGNNTLPFSGELTVTVTADPGVEAVDFGKVRDVVCSFEPDASASTGLELVAQVVSVQTPCPGTALDPAAFLALDGFLAGLGADSADVGHLGEPRIVVALPDSASPARARQVVRRLTDYLPTVPGVFVDLQGRPSFLSPTTPIDISVRVGRKTFDNVEPGPTP
jgi:hypothetical protein